MSATPELPAAWDGSSPCWPHLPQKAAVATALGITRRSSFAVTNDADGPRQARTVARSVLALMLGASEASGAVSRAVQACLTEMVGIAYTREHGSHLLCELWRDGEHIFTAVQHHEPLPLLPDETTLGLHVVKSLAADYGSHLVDGVFQMWAAIAIG